MKIKLRNRNLMRGLMCAREHLSCVLWAGFINSIRDPTTPRVPEYTRESGKLETNTHTHTHTKTKPRRDETKISNAFNLRQVAINASI